jgi:hypothetical protein
MRTIKASAYVFGTDLLGEGYGAVLDNLRQRGGLDAVSLAATYHDARDVFPHNPRYHVHRHEGDVAWFAPRLRRYESGLAPRLASAAGGADVLAALCEHAGRRGMAVDAWTIFLHNSMLATEHPDCATRNAYGDPYLTDLCPANPRVRAYCRELAGDLARYPVRNLVAESLHYRPLEHGEHHERYLIDLPAEARTLMGLCFCGHCRAAARKDGVDAEGLAGAVRDALEPVWAGLLPQGHTASLLGENARAELAAYVQVRMHLVTSLVSQVRQALAGSGVALVFMDHAGAMSHVMLGTSADDDVLRSSRKLGIDIRAVAAECDRVGALGYVDTPQRLARMLASYTAALGADSDFLVALRPLAPDCRSQDNLADKVAAVLDSPATSIDFYHYAMMPLNRLDWIRHALGQQRAGKGASA